jgi:hypothetical protein
MSSKLARKKLLFVIIIFNMNYFKFNVIKIFDNF